MSAGPALTVTVMGVVPPNGDQLVTMSITPDR